MPLEVNEIGIIMRVTEGPERTGDADGPEPSDEGREELIEECVRRVLQALKMAQER